MLQPCASYSAVGDEPCERASLVTAELRTRLCTDDFSYDVYRDAVGAIICYDMTEERSFNAVNYWVNEMMQNTTFNDGGFMMALVGNKCDLPIESIRIPSKQAI